MLPYDLQLTAELGWISDRNFLRRILQDRVGHAQERNHRRRVEGHYQDMSWSIMAQYRLNDFFTDTNWLPRADHFWLGQALVRRHVHLVRAHATSAMPSSGS